MKILITGSSGLIGSTACSMLENSGFKLTTMDTRVQPKTKTKPNFCNILNFKELSKAIQDVDGIVHLAAISRVVDAETNPKLCRLTNVDGLRNLIYLARKKHQKPWIVFASSREIYGEPSFIPVDEKHPSNPINVYGNCKKEGEELLIRQANDLSTIIFRFSNVYGSPFDYPTRVIPAFLWGTLMDKPVRVDSASNVFDFTHVDDAAGAILAAAIALASRRIEGNQIFNLSPGRGTSLAQLVEILKDLTGKKIQTVEGQKRSYDVSRYIGDSSKIKKELGFQCNVSLKEGLDLMYEECSSVWRSTS